MKGADVMFRIRVCLRWLTAAATIALLLLLAWQCIDIYLTGSSPANLDAQGVHLSPVFSAENVAVRLKSLLPLMQGYGLLVAAALLAEVCAGPSGARERAVCKGAAKSARKPHRAKPAERAFPLGTVRMVIFVVAAAFIVLGVMNGGLYDVLVKAVNICTECIGLG